MMSSRSTTRARVKTSNRGAMTRSTVWVVYEKEVCIYNGRSIIKTRW